MQAEAGVRGQPTGPAWTQKGMAKPGVLPGVIQVDRATSFPGPPQQPRCPSGAAVKFLDDLPYHDGRRCPDTRPTAAAA